MTTVLEETGALKTEKSCDQERESFSAYSLYRNARSLFQFGTFKETHCIQPDSTYNSDAAFENCILKQRILVENFKKRLKLETEFADVASLIADEFYIQCLRVRHWNLGHALETLKEFVRFRRSEQWPLQISKPVEQVLETNMQYLLPETDRHGRAVIVTNYSAIDLSTSMQIKDYQALSQFCLEQATAKNKLTQKNGVAIVLDFRNCSLQRLRQLMNIGDIRRGLNMLRVFPCKVKKCYIVNANRFMRGLLKSILLMAPKAIHSKVTFVSSSYDELRKDIPSSRLPSEYGGELEGSWKKTWWDSYCSCLETK
uniref:CRAL-TRIO domain-containing protein n=1 Tax=Aplanochytrium stocchinoi TaxID=215587 RepID=A0A7S3V234_9STRA|mmetsp:Transcript_9552/g.12392  ORF Transcript_9552/g.12392 Transcript_9552/m.12392 type:complete len:313 (+) Transcript_9552:95-1033(+)